MQKLISRFEKGIIVSCQAFENEPLFGPEMMAAMAISAEKGGACGIQANTPQDIAMIKKKCFIARHRTLQAALPRQ